MCVGCLGKTPLVSPRSPSRSQCDPLKGNIHRMQGSVLFFFYGFIVHTPWSQSDPPDNFFFFYQTDSRLEQFEAMRCDDDDSLIFFLSRRQFVNSLLQVSNIKCELRLNANLDFSCRTRRRFFFAMRQTFFCVGWCVYNKHENRVLWFIRYRCIYWEKKNAKQFINIQMLKNNYLFRLDGIIWFESTVAVSMPRIQSSETSYIIFRN